MLDQELCMSLITETFAYKIAKAVNYEKVKRFGDSVALTTKLLRRNLTLVAYTLSEKAVMTSD